MNKKTLVTGLIIAAIFVLLFFSNSPEVNKDNPPAIYGEYTKLPDVRNTKEIFKAEHKNGHWYWVSVIVEDGQDSILIPTHADDCPLK